MNKIENNERFNESAAARMNCYRGGQKLVHQTAQQLQKLSFEAHSACLEGKILKKVTKRVKGKTETPADHLPSPHSVSGTSSPCSSRWSRHSGESPATFPSAQTAWSRTSSCGERRRPIRTGTAPASTTQRVCADEPEATFVSAQADSN